SEPPRKKNIVSMETKPSMCLSLLPFLFLCFTIITLASSSSTWYDDHISLREVSQEENFNFGKDFLFGTASSAYQILKPSFFLFLLQCSVINNLVVKLMRIESGDLDLMKDLGVNSYRFSLSWARILPKGRFGDVNMEDSLQKVQSKLSSISFTGMEPFVTLTHYDMPQELECRYGSWLNPQIREDFEHYAEICFRHFGNRVKFWTTFNEPNVQVILCYRKGTYPPSRCSRTFANCTSGGSDIEPLVAAHNIIRSHLAAVSLYREVFQEKQKGKIGIVMNAIWFEPVSDSLADRLATERAQAFYLTW
ncbi:hypothetical protein F2Q69_00033659, partial [Brassica cretica]